MEDINGDTMNADQIATFLDDRLPDATCKHAVLTLLADSIETASAVGNDRWLLLINGGMVRLHVGNYQVFEIGREHIWLAFAIADLAEDVVAQLRQLQNWEHPRIRTLPDSAASRIDCSQLETFLPLVRASYLQLVQTAAESQPVHRRMIGNYAADLVAYLRSFLQRELPDPAVAPVIPLVDREQVEAALTTFDTTHRASAAWQNWEQDATHHYAIAWHGQQYPVKEIVRIATGADDFNSTQARAYLQKLGFEIVTLLQTPAGRRAAFERFRAHPANRLMIAIRQTRAAQIRDLLAAPEALTLEQFNREIWQIESGTLLDGTLIRPGIVDNTQLAPEQVEQLQQALAEGRLALHGNYIWRIPSATYHPHSHDETAKLADIRRAAAILTDPNLVPMTKVQHLKALPGFGDNTATGLVMIFHPTDFAIYNRQSREGLAKLGITFASFEEFQQVVMSLRKELGADDFIECDMFLYRINQDIAVERQPQVWWVNQGDNYPHEYAHGYLWAPLRDTANRQPAHWKTLEEVQAGDVVVHYRGNAGIVAISQVTTAAVEAPRPESSDATVGRLIATDYSALNTPPGGGWTGLEMRALISDGGPFDKNGGIRQGYLWRFSRDALRVLRVRVDTEWPAWVDAFLGREPLPQRTFAGLLETLDATGLRFPVELVSQYLLALQTKRFVIFTGISGTGKTQLAIQVAEYFAAHAKADLAVIAVRPDWTDQRGLLGFYNPLTRAYVTTPFLRFLLDAHAEQQQADAEQRAPRPFFVVLDEMNLARVEYYFADFLSVLESGQALALHDDEQLATGGVDGKQTPVPRQLSVPTNLFFTGTVNVDETTSFFSPKVLDRAFTIEFNHVDLAGFGAGRDEIADDRDTEPLYLHQFPADLLATSVPDGQPKDAEWRTFGQLDAGALRQMVETMHIILEDEGRHFGYRVANEIARFVNLAASQTDDSSDAAWAALDLAILAKILPKLTGTQQELSAILLRLFELAIVGNDQANPPISSDSQVFEHWHNHRGRIVAADANPAAITPALPRTAAKLWIMLRRLRQHGFASSIM